MIFFSDSFGLLFESTVLRSLMYLAIFYLFIYLLNPIAVLLLEMSCKCFQALNLLK